MEKSLRAQRCVTSLNDPSIRVSKRVLPFKVQGNQEIRSVTLRTLAVSPSAPSKVPLVVSQTAGLKADAEEPVKASWLAAAVGLCVAGFALCFGYSAIAAEKGAIIVGTPRVVDGDTIVIGNEKIRLFGLDAPETKQSCKDSKGHAYLCGKVSGDALREKIGKEAVQCEVKAKDLYGRNVASCSAPGTGDLGDWLVKNGHAVAYRQYAKIYVEDETAAKESHKGIWQGDFQIPADWRREQKANGGMKQGTTPDSPTDEGFGSIFSNVASFFQSSSPGRDSPSPDCQIKGNVSSSGQKIYHVPGGRYFAGVKIEPAKGEAYFCTENDAQAAGFRKSKE